MPYHTAPHAASITRNFRRRAALAMAALGLGLTAFTAGAQTLFGTNTGTFADYFPTNALNALPLRSFGSASQFAQNNYNPDPTVWGPNGSLVGNFGTVTYAQNYPSGTYVIQFDSPSPVTINTNGFFSQPNNVVRNGTHTTMNVTMTHDNGNVLAGFGFITSSGVSSSNPVSNFTVSAPGTTPSNMTSVFQGYTSKYQGTRWMNNLHINNNTTAESTSTLVPTGFNAGWNSYADIVKWTNQQANQKAVMINIPVNADTGFIAQVAKTMSGLNSGKQVIVEYGNENWNYTFTQANWLAQQGAADSRVTATDSYGKGAQEAGLRAADMMKTFKANFTGPATVSGFLGSQGSNTYFVDQSKSAIDRVYGAGATKSLFQYQGISFYPGDGLTSASDKTNLYNQLESDLSRLTGYLKADVSDAKNSGLSELIYEWSPNGYLTRGGVSQSIVDAFRADPMSKQLTLDTWNAIANNIGTNGMAFDFDVTGDGWSTQINPAVAAEYEQQAINQISASLVGVGTPLAPEPTSLGLLALGGAALLKRRRPTTTTSH